MFNKDKLLQYLAEKKLTREEFGKKVCVSATMITYLIQGRKQPSVALLKDIADAMECTVDELII